ncbi:hypothetical protein TNCV_2725201 [Trichonephila clavipes]|nr:hypothetical protein TNCV_2725201 [Trichonephila clavipes]
MRRKRENEATLEQEPKRKSDRLRMTCLTALETMQEQETRKKSYCLQKMQGRISETFEYREERLECQIMLLFKNDKDNAAYSYNPSIGYKSDASCILERMSNLHYNEV